MRSFLVLLTVCVLAACGTAPAARDPLQPRSASPNPDVEFLLTSAAADFHAHRASYPARVREVRSGYAMTADGTRQYRLCGEFLPTHEGARWIRFATLRTSGYEQWLGGQATPYCDASVTWDDGDLSPLLQRHLDALR